MELRVLRYFLEIAREGSITGAANALHISQPTLSKQIKDLEDELGCKLFERSHYCVRLTDEGMLLRKRAEDILDMADKTLDEFSDLNDITGGDIRIGAAESYYLKYLTDAICDFKVKYPRLRVHITSGVTTHVTEELEKGLSDFAVIVEPPDISKYNYLRFPEAETWGLLMKNDSPLAAKEYICPEDLKGIPLMTSKQAMKVDIPRWCGEAADQLNMVGSINLFYNGTICVRSGLAYLLVFEKLADVSRESGLCFRPLKPELHTSMYIVWKKYQVFTPIAERLIDFLKHRFSNNLEQL